MSKRSKGLPLGNSHYPDYQGGKEEMKDLNLLTALKSLEGGDSYTCDSILKETCKARKNTVLFFLPPPSLSSVVRAKTPVF